MGCENSKTQLEGASEATKNFPIIENPQHQD